MSDKRAVGMFYLVIRRYRQNERVLFFSNDEKLARTSYMQHKASLRDGDIMLWECSNQSTLEATSGGYNRTRW